MLDKEWLTVKEAAKVLGISDKTVRRRIAAGTITAEFKEGPYGMQYYIPSSVINTAQQIINTVTVKKEYDLQELALSLSNYFQERDKQYISQIDSLKSQLNEVQKMQEEHYRALDQRLTQWREDQEKNKKKKGFLFWRK